MPIQYLHTTPAPAMSGTDALLNEINTLQGHFGGPVSSLYPYAKPTSAYPILLFGMHNLLRLRRQENQADLNHIYSPAPFHLPFMYFLKKPIVYSIVGSLPKEFGLPMPYIRRRVGAYVVSNERDCRTLQERGIGHVTVIRTGLDVAGFQKEKKELDGDLVLLMASAPWEKAQFESKGIHVLLQALANLEGVRCLFVWRDVMPAFMRQLIQQYGVADKVELINEKVRMQDYYAKTHATILLANDAQLVKSYPHSLIESLLSGKPVITSSVIPMSDFVQEAGCGLVLEKMDASALSNLIGQFKREYGVLSQAARQVPPGQFSQRAMIEGYEVLYEKLFPGAVGR